MTNSIPAPPRLDDWKPETPPTPPTSRANILNTAKSYVLKDRQNDHGKPEDTFQAMADLFSAYLSTRLEVPVVLTPEDTAALMILLKVGRIIANPRHADNWVDIAGYAACGGELALRPRADVGGVE